MIVTISQVFAIIIFMDKVELNLARNAIRYIIRVYNIREINLPYYICPSLRQAIQKENCKINFYHIDENFMPLKIFDKKSYIIYPNYFGICAKNVIKLTEMYENLIVDNAHAYFMPPLGLASIYSLRKFFHVADGAILYTQTKLPQIFEKSENYILNNNSYEEFVKNELRLDREDIKLISDKSSKFLKTVNLKSEKDKRLEKFFSFHKIFKSINQLQLNLEKFDVPYVYPLLTTENVDIKALTEKPILRLWTALPEEFKEYKFYKFLIPLPLD